MWGRVDDDIRTTCICNIRGGRVDDDIRTTCIVWFGQKITLNFAIYREKSRSNDHLHISDDCTPTIDYLKLKIYRT